jgi:hypothetical protein
MTHKQFMLIQTLNPLERDALASLSFTTPKLV